MDELDKETKMALTDAKSDISFDIKKALSLVNEMDKVVPLRNTCIYVSTSTNSFAYHSLPFP
jgi:hypothetical protein